MMHKRRKQRPVLDFKSLDQIQHSQLSNNNSSSIIAFNQNQHQIPLGHSGQKCEQIKSKIIQVKARKRINFEEFEEDSEQIISVQAHRNLNENFIIPSTSQHPDQQEQKLKKQTMTTTDHQQRSCQYQQKIQTEHYSYNAKSRMSSQQDQQDVQYQNQLSQEDQSYEKNPKESANKCSIVQKKLVADSFQNFIFSPIPKNCKILCAVNFKHDILSLTRQYNLILVNEKKYLFSAIKQRFKLASQFVFQQTTSSTQQILGNLKSNFTGLQFVVIKNTKPNRSSEVCWIGYDFNILGLAHQRNITVLRNKNTKLQNIPHFSQIKNYYDNGITTKFQKFTNKKAAQNKKGQYELNFHGKVNHPSNKNFILTDQNDKQCILFGKRTQTTFILQIGHPFSIFQGFAIAVSNLDHKICVR